MSGSTPGHTPVPSELQRTLPNSPPERRNPAKRQISPLSKKSPQGNTIVAKRPDMTKVKTSAAKSSPAHAGTTVIVRAIVMDALGGIGIQTESIAL